MNLQVGKTYRVIDSPNIARAFRGKRVMVTSIDKYSYNVVLNGEIYTFTNSKPLTSLYKTLYEI